MSERGDTRSLRVRCPTTISMGPSGTPARVDGVVESWGPMMVRSLATDHETGLPVQEMWRSSCSCSAPDFL